MSNKSASTKRPPRGRIESQLIAAGESLAGIDEVGRGCLAGPVFAAYASLDYGRLRRLSAEDRSLLRDSKTLSSAQRRRALATIEQVATEWSIAMACAREIERLGIVGATFMAMKRALVLRQETCTLLLVDGRQSITGVTLPQRTVVGGDDQCYAIAVASILAKEARDGYMVEQERRYPGYGFDRHVGYGTKAHLQRIDEQGVCDLHRRNFAPIRNRVRSDPPMASA